MSETIIATLKRSIGVNDAKALIKMGLDPTWTFESIEYKRWQERTGLEIAGAPGTRPGGV